MICFMSSDVLKNYLALVIRSNTSSLSLIGQPRSGLEYVSPCESVRRRKKPLQLAGSGRPLCACNVIIVMQQEAHLVQAVS